MSAAFHPTGHYLRDSDLFTRLPPLIPRFMWPQRSVNLMFRNKYKSCLLLLEGAPVDTFLGHFRVFQELKPVLLALKRSVNLDFSP